MRETYGIGNTPMVELYEIEKKYNLKCKLFAKIEGELILERSDNEKYNQTPINRLNQYLSCR